METVPPFEELATRPCPPLDVTALAVARELRGGVDAEFARRALQQLAARGRHALEPAPRGSGLAAFALDRVLATGTGHPCVLALVAVEVGRRAGLPCALAGRGCELRALVAEPAPDGYTLRCSHQAAFALLTNAAEEAAVCGDVGGAVRALELRLKLPVGDDLRSQLDQELRAMRARLN